MQDVDCHIVDRIINIQILLTGVIISLMTSSFTIFIIIYYLNSSGHPPGETTYKFSLLFCGILYTWLPVNCNPW